MGGTFSSEAEGQGQENGQQTNNKIAERPSALVICGPSGVGKGTLIKKLMDGSPLFGFSCSHTTRAPREGEQVILFQNNCNFRGCPPNCDRRCPLIVFLMKEFEFASTIVF